MKGEGDLDVVGRQRSIAINYFRRRLILIKKINRCTALLMTICFLCLSCQITVSLFLLCWCSDLHLNLLCLVGTHFPATLPNCPHLDWYHRQIKGCWFVPLNSNSRSIVLNPIQHSFKISYQLWWWCRSALPCANRNVEPFSQFIADFHCWL